MDFRKVETKGIGYVEPVKGSKSFYWGSDLLGGDLYEAEETFRAGHEMRSNRVVLVSYPEGVVYEPLKASQGQYLGRPVCSEGMIYLLLVDFFEEKIRIYRWDGEAAVAEVFVELPLSEVKDCYNLMLTVEPLTLTRQGAEDRFQVVWPEKGDFEIYPQESLEGREGDVLLFARWFEDPDYREETYVRAYPGGELVQTEKGCCWRMPDGSVWLVG